MKNLLIAFSLVFLMSCEKKNTSETTKNEDSTKIVENEERTPQTQENVEIGHAAIFKDIAKENDVYLISVDNIEEKYSSPRGNDQLKIETINKNSKIDVFELNEKALIQNDKCENITAEFVYAHKKQFLERKEKIGYTTKDGKITSLNFGCWQ